MEEGCKGCEFSDDEEEEDVDPRVKDELDSLNAASNEINILETELERGRTAFRSLLSDSGQKLNLLCKKLGKCISRGRPYYEMLKDSRRAQAEAQRAAVNFQRANSVYRAAKETVSLAEEKLVNKDPSEDKWQFDSAWQEMLNHATMKFMESEKEKTTSEEEHCKKAIEYASIQQKLIFMEKDIPRSISKARPYFEMKERLEHQLQMERMNVDDLSRALTCAKQRYKASLDSLEAISEEVHRKRKRHIDLPPRTPGVGAESNSDQSDLPSINLDVMSLSDTASQISYDEHSLVTEHDISLARNLYRDPMTDSPKLALKRDNNAELRMVNGVGVRDSPSPSPKLSLKVGMREQARESGSGQDSSGGEDKVERKMSSNVSVNVNVKTAEGGSLRKGGIGAYLAQRQGSVSEGGYDSSDSSTQGSPVMVRRRKKKLQTQKAFPILQGLSATNKQMSPRLMRASAAQGRFEAVVIENDGSPKHHRSNRALSWQQEGELLWKQAGSSASRSSGSPKSARQTMQYTRQKLVATEISGEAESLGFEKAFKSAADGQGLQRDSSKGNSGKTGEQPAVKKSGEKEEIFV